MDWSLVKDVKFKWLYFNPTGALVCAMEYLSTILIIQIFLFLL